MISRIETIEDLTIWLGCIVNLKTKNVKFDNLNLTVDQIGDFAGVQDTLSKIKSKLPDPFKQCCKCKEIYPETKEWFGWCGQGRTGLKATCKFCCNAYNKKYQKAQRKVKNHQGYSSSADLEEINYHRELEGKPPLDSAPAKKRGRPRGSKEKRTFIPTAAPKPGERY